MVVNQSSNHINSKKIYQISKLNHFQILKIIYTRGRQPFDLAGQIESFTALLGPSDLSSFDLTRNLSTVELLIISKYVLNYL